MLGFLVKKNYHMVYKNVFVINIIIILLRAR